MAHGADQRIFGAFPERRLEGRPAGFALGAALALALAGGCGNGVEVPGPDLPLVQPPAPPPQLAGALVSEPLARELGALVTAQAGFAYVSLPPGMFPTGRQATIRNPANGRQETVPMVNGGWDPVAIAAKSGDTLRITIATEQGGTIEYAHLVPPVRRPVILRTDPPRRKRDVPLNAVLLVVFSEPIEPSTVTPQSVQLLHDGQPVGAGTEISADGLRITIRPEGQLLPGTEYLLVLSPELADLSGDPLEQGAEVEFTTALGAVDTRGLAFVRGSSVFGSPVDGSEAVALVTDGSRPAWSPDGTRLAFTRPSDNSLAKWQLCIAQADGTDIRCATGPEDGDVSAGPSWSADGSTVAFSVYIHNCRSGQCSPYFSGLSLLNTRTMQVETLATPQVWSLSWSPDGRRIAISIFGAGLFGRGALGIVNADGSGLEILAESFGTYSVREVAWSPDGSRLALTLWDENACPWYCDMAIGVVNVDGTVLRVLDRAPTADQVYFWTPPAWSQDGVHVAYTVSRGEACYLHHVPCNEIAVVRVETGGIGLLISPGAFPSWRR